MSEGPEDRVIEQIWTGDRGGRRLAVRVGSVSVPATHWVVWFPFLVSLVIAVVGIAAILPTDLAGGFLEVTFRWVGLFRGELSAATIGSLVFAVVGLAVALLVYLQLFKLVLGWLSGERGR